MAFSESERVQIRRWLGYSRMYASFNPILESVITNAQASGDGGSMVDNSTELAVRGWLTELGTIETRMKELEDQMQAHKLGNLTVDPLRALAGLRSLGRQYVGHLSDALSAPLKRDVFSPAVPG